MLFKTVIAGISSQVSRSLTVIPVQQRLKLRPFYLHHRPCFVLRTSSLTMAAGDRAPDGASRRMNSKSVGDSVRRNQRTSTQRRTHPNDASTHPTKRNGRNSSISRLPEPAVLFSNNHLLFINKPAGYHSQPNESIEQKPSKKCLLSKLKASELGGGSAKNFLLPMHRLDQPCTGIIMLAKNSKAGTRTGNSFRKHTVEKDYFCVVEGNLKNMMMRSEPVSKKNGSSMYKLSGILMPTKAKNGSRQNKGGRSVVFKPFKDGADTAGKRVCYLEWEHLKSLSGNNHLIRVITGTGAKHQVRAMMSQLAKSPLCGDLRYGSSEPLPDQSVALHARSLRLPNVSLGDMDLKSMRFVAPIPNTWSQFFSLKEGNIRKIKYD